MFMLKIKSLFVVFGPPLMLKEISPYCCRAQVFRNKLLPKEVTVFRIAVRFVLLATALKTSPRWSRTHICAKKVTLLFATSVTAEEGNFVIPASDLLEGAALPKVNIIVHSSQVQED